MTKQEEDQLRKTFENIDTNGDGELSLDEIRHAYRKSRLTTMT